MTREEILNNIASLLRQNRCRLGNVSEQTGIDQFEMDSVHLTAFLMDLEEFFRVLATDQECGRWKTVGDIMQYIENYLTDAEHLNTVDIDLVTDKKTDLPDL